MIIDSTNQLFAYLHKLLPDNPIIIEAGAFNGSDTLKMIKTWPTASIYAFEPLPQRFQELKNNTATHKNIHTFQLALSDHNGTETLYVAQHPERPQKPSQASSLRKPKERMQHSPITFPSAIEVATITLNSFIKQRHINHIDLLWLDLQGHELTVIKSAEPLLSMIDFIYTEVSFIEAYEGQPVYNEVKQWLEKKGFYEIARDFNNTTDHFFGNILVKRETS